LYHDGASANLRGYFVEITFANSKTKIEPIGAYLATDKSDAAITKLNIEALALANKYYTETSVRIENQKQGLIVEKRKTDSSKTEKYMLVTEVIKEKSNIPFLNKFAFFGTNLTMASGEPHEIKPIAVLERCWLHPRQIKEGDIIELGIRRVPIPTYSYNPQICSYDPSTETFEVSGGYFDVGCNYSQENAFAGFVSNKNLRRIRPLFTRMIS
jgi:hypothetical protein